MDIRRAAPADVPAILEIFRIAKAYMAAHGNAGQWGGDYPGLPELLPDIARGHSYVLTDGGVIVGTFSFIIGDEPTYRVLLNGHWHADRPYGTIHRLASAGESKGIGKAVVEWCLEHCESLRADTHADNKIMQHLLEKNGFARCGIILADDGKPRIVTGDLKTIMAGLACGEPNTISWDILRNHVSAFISCPDWVSAKGMRMLSSPVKGDPRVVSGESGAVGMLSLIHI